MSDRPCKKHKEGARPVAELGPSITRYSGRSDGPEMNGPLQAVCAFKPRSTFGGDAPADVGNGEFTVFSRVTEPHHCLPEATMWRSLVGKLVPGERNDYKMIPVNAKLTSRIQTP